MRILGIGGSVVKEAHDELREICRQRMIDVLMHCGGSIFHDFQRTTQMLPNHSFPLEVLMEDYGCNKEASELVWKWLETDESPEGSVTNICKQNNIRVMIYTVLGADFWHLFDHRWGLFAIKTKYDFEELCNILINDNFHYINLGSAVVMPEVFTKALAYANMTKKPKHYRCDVVDFLKQYRPETRIAKYGKYLYMDEQEFLKQWLLLKDVNKVLGIEK